MVVRAATRIWSWISGTSLLDRLALFQEPEELLGIGGDVVR
jgi:hypothetical protein